MDTFQGFGLNVRNPAFSWSAELPFFLCRAFDRGYAWTCLYLKLPECILKARVKEQEHKGKGDPHFKLLWTQRPYRYRCLQTIALLQDDSSDSEVEL